MCIAAAKVLLIGVVLPGLRACDETIHPIEGLFDLDLSFLLAPHIFGLIAAVSCSLFLTSWARRHRGVELAVIIWSHLAWVALAVFFAMATRDMSGWPILALGCGVFPWLLMSRAGSWRWRAVRALWVGALECMTWYGFFIALAANGPESASDAILWGSYVSLAGCSVLFVVGRRLEREVPRWP